MLFPRDPLRFVTRLIAEYGDITRFRLGPIPIILVNHPDHIRHILVDGAGNYERDSTPHRIARTIFGNGLASVVGGESWLEQRRMLQPAFHKNRIAQLYETIRDTVLAGLDTWEQHVTSGRPIDIEAEMNGLALQVVLRSLFKLDLDRACLHQLTGSVAQANRGLAAHVRTPFIPLSVPTPAHRRFRRSMHQIDEIVNGIIDRHQHIDGDGADLLSMMISAEDQDTGERMSKRQLRDEVFTMLFAGHETSANTLSWVWYLLAKHPEIEEKAHAEVDAVLGGRVPTTADLARLPWIRAIIDETLRLYPPGWQGYRSARVDDNIAGYSVPRGTTVFYSSYHLHRHQSFWTDPELFKPDRFLTVETERRHRGAYIPFGEGRHLCIGKPLAMLEIPLVIAATLQRYRLTLTQDETVEPAPLVTLRMTNPVRMQVTRR
ncbi:cytochrome P450 [Nocardia sp. NBC_00881]|uniref:cytochrome P450 n=1 Tax=Nocardia sp. NBC_00881 TaxID=2975995 RepID=UPI00386A195F|nr:cytochrome P450 [Nocardia sp. NBC_00881]